MRDEAATHEAPWQPGDAAPAPERQAELHAAYEANTRAGRPPYAAVAIRSRHELHWIMTQRGWASEVHRRPAVAEVTSSSPVQPWRPTDDDEASLVRRADLHVAQAVAETISYTQVARAAVASVVRPLKKRERRRRSQAPLAGHVVSRRYGSAPGTGGHEQDYADLREANLFGINLEGVFL